MRTATETCGLGVGIVASRIAGRRIRLADTIADNASYGGFTLGLWDQGMVQSDLDAPATSIHHNGAPEAEGVGRRR